MEYRSLGNTGLEVSRVSLGTGGPSRLGQRTHGDEVRSHAVVRAALDAGINLFDTAAAYSDSEGILGRALTGVPRDNYLLATKCVVRDEQTNDIITGEAFVESCEKSLRQLDVDEIDIFQFHGLEPYNYATAVERLFPVAEELQRAGKIRLIGVTEYFYRDPGHEMLRQALADNIWSTIMVKYGILNMTAADHVFPLAEKQGVGVFNMSPVRLRLTRTEKLEELISEWKQLGLIAADALPDKDPLGFVVGNGVGSVIEAGYKFGAAHSAISSVVVGTGDTEHLRDNIETINGPPLDDRVCDKLRSIFGSIAETELLKD